MTILIATESWSPEEWRAALLPHAGAREIRLWPEIGDPADIDTVLAWHPPDGLFERLTNLKAILSLGAGVDHILKKPFLPDVPIARVVDPNMTMRMREWVVLQTLIHHRRHLAYDAQQREATWRPIPQPAASAVRVGMLGLGVLGLDSGRALAALGFDVAGWSRTAKPGIDFPTFHGADGLDPFLARTDILICLLPHTPATEGLIDAKLLGKLARDGALGGPVLINAGRGKVQVEADILKALEDGTLKAASLDVFETEPLPEASPLWRHPAVVITPHVAADSEPAALAAAIMEQVRRCEAGEAMANLVDREAGY